MRKLLLLNILLILGACSTAPSIPTEETEEPLIGPLLKLTKKNETEDRLLGSWKYDVADDKRIFQYRYHPELGKQYLTYDQNGELSSCMSFEIKENFKGEGKHLFVMYYTLDKEGKVPAWNEMLVYQEIQILLDNTQYTWYQLGYDLIDPNVDINDPRTLKYMTVDGGNIPIGGTVQKIVENK